MEDAQKRAALVLRRLSDTAERSEADALVLCKELQPILDELRWNWFFGTYGECDPRGDFRKGEWSMDRVEGIDG